MSPGPGDIFVTVIDTDIDVDIDDDVRVPFAAPFAIFALFASDGVALNRHTTEVMP